jgi:2-keto-4-pentenoate hydratase/2-oxohepta-3-ene-1,7-dioic acid hydratase in catechol pathway
MQLATFVRDVTQLPEIGVVVGDSVHPAPPGFAIRDMNHLIAAWQDCAASVATWPDVSAPVNLATVRLLAPVPRPSKILAIGQNYAAHAAETSASIPDRQIWFSKAVSAVNGPFAPIALPKASTMVDYEVELVAVIGRRCRHVTPDTAASVIFGYCVGNDVSARDWQLRTPQWVLGKSFDTHAPFGPWLTTADAVADPHRLDLTCRVNGEPRQSANTHDMVFDVFAQVAELSQVMTLEPGDIIYTGTPSGVGMAMSPPRYLAAGDRVTCEISGLGSIEGVMMPE